MFERNKEPNVRTQALMIAQDPGPLFVGRASFLYMEKIFFPLVLTILCSFLKIISVHPWLPLVMIIIFTFGC